MDNTTIFICTYIYIRICALARPGFRSGGRISCKPNNGPLLSTSINKHDDNKSPNHRALLGTLTNSSNDNKIADAGVDILALLLAEKIVT